MYSVVLPNGIEPAIQSVFLTILAVFFVLMIASWWVASQDWQKEEAASMRNDPESDVEPKIKDK